MARTVSRVGIIRVLVDGSSGVIFREEFFDLPVVLLGANRELEVLAGDGIPVLIHVSYLAKEKSVEW